MPRELIKEGSLVRLKSGTEGWVKGRVVEYFDVIPTAGGYMYGGGMTPGYKVHILEGKHKGETLRVPENYVEPIGPAKPGGEPLYPHVPKSRQPLFPHVPKTYAPGDKRMARREGEWVYAKVGDTEMRGKKVPTGIDFEQVSPTCNRGDLEKAVNIITEFFGERPQTKEKLYQRAADGYPIGADKIMRDAWGPIPNPDQPFWSGKGFIKPVMIYGWQWSPDYHSWRAYVRFPDGTETWTSPREQTGGSLELLASTEGDPIRKFCCRQCGECAPSDLLEEGKFPDRISWLRSHYKEKHPGMWGKRLPLTIVEGGELVPPQYRHLVGLVSEPLPKEAD